MQAPERPDAPTAPPLALDPERDPLRPAAGPREPPSPVRVPRVLVIEDDLEGAAALATTLEALGYAVRQVHDGGLAIAAALEFRPDAIVSDIDLPHRDGFELAEAFGEDPAFRDTPVIALTGRLDRDEWVAALEGGFTRFLAKPARPDELAAMLAELLAPRQ